MDEVIKNKDAEPEALAFDERSKFSGMTYTPTSIDRARWNVLDVLSVFGKKAIPATLICDIDMQAAEQLRGHYKKEDIEISPTAILIKSIAMAQKNHPITKSFPLPFCRIATPEEIVAGVTVERAVDGKPVVFFGTIDRPDDKSLEEISTELRAYAETPVEEHPVLKQQSDFVKMPWLVRQFVFWLASINPAVRLRYMPATFGLTSLGKFGIDSLGGPAVCTTTFAVGSITDRTVVRNGALAVRPIMELSLIFDHIVTDGGPVARFLQEFRSIIESGLQEKPDSSEERSSNTVGLPVRERRRPTSAA